MIIKYNENLYFSLLENLTKMLDDFNRKFHTFSCFLEVIFEIIYPIPLQMVINGHQRPTGEQQVRYNAPHGSKIPIDNAGADKKLVAQHRDMKFQRCGIRNEKRNIVYSELNLLHRS